MWVRLTSLQKMEETQEKAMKKAAKEAVTSYNAVLSDALTNDPILRSVVQECVSKKLMNPSELQSLFDPYINRSLSARASDFVYKMLIAVEMSPENLDGYLCILHKSGNAVVQDAAKKIAEKCQHDLPLYEEAVSAKNNETSPLSPVVPPISDSVLNITDLNKVRTALRDGNFRTKKWLDLGEELGLHANTLDTIEDDNKDADRRLRECLVKWLERADAVDEKGGARWSTLVKALKAVGQKDPAAHITNNYCS